MGLTFDSTGRQNNPGATFPPGSPNLTPGPSVIKRVTSPVSDPITSGSLTGIDFCNRYLVRMPVTTKRWRVRIANRSTYLNGIGSCNQPFTLTGVWLGQAAYPPFLSGSGVNARWNGGMLAGTPVQALPAAALPLDGTDYVSGWVSNLPISGGVPMVISLGLITAGTLNYYYEGVLANGLKGLFYTGAGASAGAGSPGAPAGLVSYPGSALDVRLEYEFETPKTGGVPVVVCVGDSITSGYTGGAVTADEGLGTQICETWPWAAGWRSGFAAINLGVGSSSTPDWTDITKWVWKRADLATTPPDAAVISLGSNDIADGDDNPPGAMEPNIALIMGILRAFGIPRIYLGTVIPRDFAGAAETARTTLNAWITGLPWGADGIFDFDKATRLATNPAVLDPDFLVGAVGVGNPHPSTRGYQKMASAVALGASS